jgi:flavin-dependent dehydrogenase
VDTPLPDRPVVMAKREEFDAYLLARSEADVLEGTAVTGVTEAEETVRVDAGDRTLTARYIVGADGALSQVAKSLGLRPKRPLGGALEAEVPLPGHSALWDRYDRQALFVFGVAPWCYVWVFPKGDHLSVGIAQFRIGRVPLRSAFQQQMERMGIEIEGAEVRGHPLPSYGVAPWPVWHVRNPEPLATRRCVLVGDAAGLVDSFLGEGIRYAIGSARLAAEGIVSDNLSGYDQAVWQEMGHSLATAGLVAGVFYRWPKTCFQVGMRNPAAIQLAVDLFSERHSYEGIGRRLIATTTRWLLNGRGLKDEAHTKPNKVAYSD